MRKQINLLIFVLLLSVSGLAAHAQDEQPRWDPRQEVELGAEASAAIEAEYTLMDAPRIAEKLAKIAEILAVVSERPEVMYQCKILHTPEVNAFSIPGGKFLEDGSVEPGGYIYLTSGLLDFLRSDHELAGILAHEIAHTAHYDLLRQLEDHSRRRKDTWLAALLGLFVSGGDLQTVGLIYVAAQLVDIAKTHSLSIEFEKEADSAAVRYLSQTDYSPVGLLTFMERLAARKLTDPEEWGIFQTHPAMVERAVAISNQLLEMEIEINRRQVVGGLWAQVVIGETDGVETAEVRMGEHVIFSPSPVTNAEERAQRCAKALNRLMWEGLELFEAQAETLEDGSAQLVARGIPILTYLPEDGDFYNATPQELARASREALGDALWEESISRPSESLTPPSEPEAISEGAS